MFNEYSFVPRSAILNGLGSLRILPYRPFASGTRPIKERWRGGREREKWCTKRDNRLNAMYSDRGDRETGEPVLRASL